jgi:hypothetical protein
MKIEISERHETIMFLLSNYCERNEKGLEIAAELKMLLMVIENEQNKNASDFQYVNSKEFIETAYLIDAIKINLIKFITAL